MSDVHIIGGLSVACREGTCDQDVATSCIEQDEYQIRRLAKRGAWMIDLGAYCGHASLLAASLGMKCLAVEPVPENVAMIRRNIELNGMRYQITVIHGAIGNGKMWKIWTGDNQPDYAERHRFIGTGSAFSGFDRKWVEVQSVTLNQILAPSAAFRLIKCDCEGGEWELLSADKEQLAKVDWIVGEYHPTEGKTFADFRAGLPQFVDVSEVFGYEELPTLRMFAFRHK